MAALTDEALLEDADALKACYVKSSERVKYDSRLKMHLSDSKPFLERKVVRPRKTQGCSGARSDDTKDRSKKAAIPVVARASGCGQNNLFTLHLEDLSCASNKEQSGVALR